MHNRTLRHLMLALAAATAVGSAAAARADLVYSLEVDGTGAHTATMAAGGDLTVALYATMTDNGNPGFLIGGGSFLATGGSGTGSIGNLALATGLDGGGSALGGSADLNGDGYTDWGNISGTHPEDLFYASSNLPHPQPVLGAKIKLGTFTFHLSTFSNAGSIALTFAPQSRPGDVNQIWHQNYDPNQTTTAPLYNALDDTFATVSTGLGVTVSLPSNEWKNVLSGDFSAGANWTGAVAPGQADTANFLALPTAPASVRLTTPATVGGLTFNNAHGYTVYTQNNSKLTINHAGGATISVQSGQHAISAPVALASDTTFNVAAGSQLSITGPIDAGTSAIAKTGPGTLSASRLQNQSLSITSGTVQLASGGGAANVTILGGLSITGGQLDVTDNDLIIRSADVNTVAAYIYSAYHDGAWDGVGIGTSLGSDRRFLAYATGSVLGTFDGQMLDPSDVAVKYTYAGDLNLNGVVDAADFAVLAAHYNGAARYWGGDLNDDGVVDAADFAVLAANYNKGVAGSPGMSLAEAMTMYHFNSVAVPEPASLLLVGAAGLLLLTRRRCVL